MSQRQIAKSTLWQLGSQVIMAALSIVTVKLVAEGLSKELAGLYNTAYGYLQLFGILADFGLYAVAIREISTAGGKKEQEKVLGNLIVLRCGILAVSMGTALAIAWLVPAWSGTPLPLSITIASLVPSFTLLAGILRTVFQVNHKMQFVFVAEVLQRVLTAGVMAGFVYAGVRGSENTDYLYLFLGVGSLGALLLYALSLLFGCRLMKIRPRIDADAMGNLLTQAAPYGIAYLFTALYRQFDVTLIATLRPQDFEVQNAMYGFVQRMMDMAYLLPTILLNSTLPLLSDRVKKNEDTRAFVGRIFFTIVLLSLTAFLFSFFWPRALSQLLINDSYLSTASQPGSDTALRLLSISMFMNGIILFSFYSLLARHVWKPLVSTLFLGVLISLFLNLTLIPGLGFVGASYTSVATHAMLAALLLPQSLRVLPMTLNLRMALQAILYGTILGLFLWGSAPYLDSPLKTAGALAGAGILILALARFGGIQKALVRE